MPNNHVLSLPIELQTRILSCLGIKSQSVARRVCPLWTTIIDSAPSIRRKRYTSWVETGNDGIYVSKTSAVHKLFSRWSNHGEFMVQIDPWTGRIEKWILRASRPTRSTGWMSGEDISGSPFLDDPVLDMKAHCSQESIERLTAQFFGVYGSPAVENANKFSVAVAVNDGGMSIPRSWGLNLTDFQISYSNTLPVSEIQSFGVSFPGDSDIREEELSGLLTVRDVVETFAMKLDHKSYRKAPGQYCLNPVPYVKGLKFAVEFEVKEIDKYGKWIIWAVIRYMATSDP